MKDTVRRPLSGDPASHATISAMFGKQRSPVEVSPAVAQLRDADLAVRLESLIANATEHIRQERELLLVGGDIPTLPAKLCNRPVLVLHRKFRWKDDLARLKRWISDRDPVLIGVGNGVEALLDAGYRPDVVVGALDEISDLALHECRHVVVSVTSERAKTKDGRLERFGVDPVWFVSSGKSSDLALLLADASKAPVIVEAGAPAGLSERLDGSADDVASSFVTRLRVSTRVVDAPAVARLSARSASLWPPFLVLLVGILSVGMAIAATPVGFEWITGPGGLFETVTELVRGVAT